MRSGLWLLCNLLCFSLCAQHRVTLRLAALPAAHRPADPVFLSGSFNNWNPGQKEAQFVRAPGGTYELTLAAPAGRIEFKLTRGSWQTVETDARGQQVANRQLDITGDTTVQLSVGGWADQFAAALKKSTAGPRVSILSERFYIPQLDRWRRVWVYLPADYQTSRKRYPVLYLHDGQNMFEDSTSFSGEWGVDEALDTLEKTFGSAIVVAIDNGGDKRLNEYAPFDMERFGKGEGKAYADFLVHTLRPYIRKQFRVKRCGRHHYTAGSSMGGLISLYAVLEHPKKWGGAGVFSPAFWVNPQIKQLAGERGKKFKGRIWFYAGKEESESMVPDLLAVFGILNRVSKARMTTVIRTGGKHTEADWRREFPGFYQWLMRK